MCADFALFIDDYSKELQEKKKPMEISRCRKAKKGVEFL